jgi:hypothetical protein
MAHARLNWLRKPEAGRFEEAISTAQTACRLATGAGDTNLLEENQRLLELFVRRRSYHDQPR